MVTGVVSFNRGQFNVFDSQMKSWVNFENFHATQTKMQGHHAFLTLAGFHSVESNVVSVLQKSGDVALLTQVIQLQH